MVNRMIFTVLLVSIIYDLITNKNSILLRSSFLFSQSMLTFCIKNQWINKNTIFKLKNIDKFPIINEFY